MRTAATHAGPRHEPSWHSRLDVEVVIPVRWPDVVASTQEKAFERSLRAMAAVCDVTVVDGSEGPGAEERRRRWSASARVLRPDPRWAGLNGKVTGAMTGVAAARHHRVVIADDDVRHDAETLRSLRDALDVAELVVPQNHWTRWTWWSWWDSGRALLNRAVAVDWPGTAAVHRDTVLAMGGWSPDVLFENLEMARAVRAAGGRVRVHRDLLVPRDPPPLPHFLSQRVRQAYEDQADPLRLVLGLGILPSVLALRRRRLVLALGAAGVVALAELGRRRGGGRRVFPWFTSLAAPLWLVERAVCSWIALLARLRGGLGYHGTRIRVAAHRPSRRAVRTPSGRRRAGRGGRRGSGRAGERPASGSRR